VKRLLILVLRAAIGEAQTITHIIYIIKDVSWVRT